MPPRLGPVGRAAGLPSGLHVAYVEVGGDEQVGIQPGPVPATGDRVLVDELSIGSRVQRGQPRPVTAQGRRVVDGFAQRVKEPESLSAERLDAERPLMQESMVATAQEKQVVRAGGAAA
jgi:hypothetical protein